MSVLMVRDEAGLLRTASEDEVMNEALKAAAGRLRRGRTVGSAKAAIAALRVETSQADRECVWCLYLDAKKRAIKLVREFAGCLDQCEAHPRKIVQNAIKLDARSVILARNVMSDGHAVSGADANAASRIGRALELIGVAVLDHLIIAPDGFTSLLEEGLL